MWISTNIILIDLLIKVKFGHSVLVDLNHSILAFGVELVPANRKHILVGIGNKGIRRQLHTGIALPFERLGRVKPHSRFPRGGRAWARDI